MTFSMKDLLERKRDGQALRPEELRWIVAGYTSGDIPDYQMSSLLMAIVFRGLDGDELPAWTDAMLRSGDVLDFSHVAAPKVDKHSTGGVGDKVSIALAPMVAACGVAIPMMSGRGLGHTGGTLDKLETIPGFRAELDPAEFRRVMERTGLVLAGQSETLVPADRKIYGLRDATGTVPSIPLIASSIMSKKLAEGLDGLVLDVKVGTGAFMKSLERARELARTMVDIGSAHDTEVRAVLTRMDQPLGHEVGNACEMVESVEVLRGEGPADLVEVTFRLGEEMLLLARVADDRVEARRRLEEAVDSGAALDKLAEVAEAQGGDPAVIHEPDRFASAPNTHVVEASRAGHVTRCDALDVGVAALRLGAGREQTDDHIDPGVGIRVEAKLGDEVEAGDALAVVRWSDEDRLAACLDRLDAAFAVDDEAPDVPPVVIEEIS
ncbi:MAG: thymidine phosphorylase [Acidimicrobiia bacterium]|nr:thymidine phosphorylase [Acidimicrobiia bacterium]